MGHSLGDTHFESEVALLSLTPAVLPIKVEVSSLLIVLRYSLRIMSALEPGQILLVEPPRLLLQFLSSQPSNNQSLFSRRIEAALTVRMSPSYNRRYRTIGQSQIDYTVIGRPVSALELEDSMKEF